MDARPRLLVFSSLFPHPGQPTAGLFIRERMFRVAKRMPLVVVAPVPWFPCQCWIRVWRPHFRPPAPYYEMQQGIEVYHPRYFSVPGMFKFLDGLFMALGSFPLMLRLRRRWQFDLIDAHFAYPDGYAAALLGRWFDVPVTITLRGTESRHSRSRILRPLVLKALQRASRVFSVASSLKSLAVGLGIDANKIVVVGNGVDVDKFQPVPKREVRRAMGLPLHVPVLVTVGGLVERKGFHRVIERLPRLRQDFPGLQYLIVGGSNAEGDWGERLKRQVAELRLQECVRFMGMVPPDSLKTVLSAADLFVLATRNEGWANVLLEAMACGLPVVATDVGGNTEVICHTELGFVVPFGDGFALEEAVRKALRKRWNYNAIIRYARANSWEQRVEALAREFRGITGRRLYSCSEM